MSNKKIKNLFLLQTLLCWTLLSAFTGCAKSTDEKTQTTAFEIDNDYQRGPLTVHVRIDKNKLTIAETILLEFEAAVTPDFKVNMPKVDKVLENFGIIDWENLGDKLDENNNVISTYQYRLEPFLSGSFQIPAFTFEFFDINDAENKKHELTTEPVEIEVTSLLGEQRANLQIAAIEDVLEMPEKPSYWWVGLLGTAGVAAILYLCLYLRRKRVKELIRIFKPAHEIAYDRLRKLVAQDLVNAGKFKEFYECISDILRHYIEHRFNLKAPERTTEEFLTELSSADILPQSDQQRLAEFLTHCDLVKFAKHTPTSEQIQTTFNLVKDFIETTKSDEKKIDVTETVLKQSAETVSV